MICVDWQREVLVGEEQYGLQRWQWWRGVFIQIFNWVTEICLTRAKATGKLDRERLGMLCNGPGAPSFICFKSASPSLQFSPTWPRAWRLSNLCQGKAIVPKMKLIARWRSNCIGKILGRGRELVTGDAVAEQALPTRVVIQRVVLGQRCLRF